MRLTRDTLGRWGTVAPGPAEEGLSWGLGEERLPGPQHPQEPGQWQKESYWPEVQEAGAGLGAEALKAARKSTHYNMFPVGLKRLLVNRNKRI